MNFSVLKYWGRTAMYIQKISELHVRRLFITAKMISRLYIPRIFLIKDIGISILRSGREK